MQGALANSFILPIIQRDGVRIQVAVTVGELKINLHFERKEVTYSLENYAVIRDFAAMLELLEPGAHWDGSEFLGNGVGLGTDFERFAFSRRGSGMQILFTPIEWHALRDSFTGVLALSAIQPVLADLSMAYGEI
jgi:hypothetical protein